MEGLTAGDGRAAKVRAEGDTTKQIVEALNRDLKRGPERVKLRQRWMDAEGGPPKKWAARAIKVAGDPTR